MSKEESELKFGASSIYGLNEIIKISDPTSFLKWNSINKKIVEGAIFHGYNFFLESILRALTNTLLNQPLIDLKEDYVYFRARHKGIELSKIPNSCEKVVFLKNVYAIIRDLRKANNFSDLAQVYLKIKSNICEPIDAVINTETNINEIKLGIKTIRKISMAYWALIYLNQIRHGVPQGYFVSCFPDKLNAKTYGLRLLGYSLTLEFIWSNILKKDYSNYPLSKMHNSTFWSDDYDFFAKRKKSAKKEVFLDDFFGIINNSIINPMQKKYHFNAFSSEIIYFKRKVNKKYFKLLLKPVSDPNLTFKECFDYTTFWYEMEVLSSKNDIFNGVATFIPLLRGIVENKIRYGIDEKSYVIRFKHPDKSVNGNDFSYGLLIQSYGTFFSDFSGWIVFEDCCGDYSRFAGNEHFQAERVIKEYASQDLVEVKEISISKKEFEKYLTEKATFRNITRENKHLRETVDTLSEARGLLFELFAYYYTSRAGSKIKLDWQVKTKHGDVDLLITSKNSKILIECKLDPTTTSLQEEVNKIENKLKALKGTRYELWFWFSPTPKQKAYLLNKKVTYKIISEEIKNKANLNKDLNKIFRVLGKDNYKQNIFDY